MRKLKGARRVRYSKPPGVCFFIQQILSAGGSVNLKTDSPVLYNFTKQVIELYQLPLITDISDLYATDPMDLVLTIKTHYENLDIAQSKRVHYLKFGLPVEPLPDKDNELKELILETESDRGN